MGFHLNVEALNETHSVEVVSLWLSEVRTGLSPSGRSTRLLESDSFSELKESGYTILQIGLPFKPLWKTEDGSWRFWCPRLDIKTGLCSDYANRPAVCRDYVPGIDCTEIPSPHIAKSDSNLGSCKNIDK